MKRAPKNNLERMIQLAEKVFAVRSDPSQLSVNGRVMHRLRRIHPSTITEKSTRNGPVAWMLVLPTTHHLMEQFLTKQINERELYAKTPLHTRYDSIYLCSALVLPEYRGKGLAKKLMMKAIKSICKQHPINALYYWEFSKAGRRLAQSVSQELHLPLHQRPERPF
jgi:GNAT superfamily N-acetyltransferase